MVVQLPFIEFAPSLKLSRRLRFADDQKACFQSAVESRSGTSKQMDEAEARPGGYARTNQSGCRAPTSAALGRFHAPRTAQVPQIRPLRPLYPLRTRWRPACPLSPCSHSRLRFPRVTTTPDAPILPRMRLRPMHACASSAATAPCGRLLPMERRWPSKSSLAMRSPHSLRLLLIGRQPPRHPAPVALAPA
jgi:hypothetical protein